MIEIPFLDIALYDVSISYENLHLLIAVVAGILLVHLITLKKSEERAINFSNYEILEELMGEKEVMEKNLLPLILRILAISFIVFSITNFQVTVEGYQADNDLMFTIDSSATMLNPDIPPSRLEAAKEAVVNFLDNVPDGTRLGVVTYAGDAVVNTEMTDDQDLVRGNVQNITYMDEPGTAIGDAIIQSTNELELITGNKTMFLLADGTLNRGVSIPEALTYTDDKNITINTIGIGSPENETETVQDIIDDLPDDIDIDDIDEATVTGAPGTGYNRTNLERIANYTGGQFFSVNETGQMEDIYTEIALQREIITFQPTFYLLAAAAVLLIIEWSLGMTKYKTLP